MLAGDRSLLVMRTDTERTLEPYMVIMFHSVVVRSSYLMSYIADLTFVSVSNECMWCAMMLSLMVVYDSLNQLCPC